MSENRIINPRHEVLKLEVGRLIGKLVGADEIDYVIERLQGARRKAKDRAHVAIETRSREFLNQRWSLYGTLYEGPWPVTFGRPLVVAYSRSGVDFSTSKTYTNRFAAEITEATFLRLGRKDRARYVELELPAEKIMNQFEREAAGLKADEPLTVYCTIFALFHAQPKWVLDTAMKKRLTRLRTIAAEAAAKVAP